MNDAAMSEAGDSVPDPADRTLSEEDRRELISWAAACVERLLPTFNAHRPDDQRLRDALQAVEGFRAGTISVGPMRKLAFGCHDAARDCQQPDAAGVARACGQAIAVAHMGGHARNVARYTKKVLHGEALAEELAWQSSHLPSRFGDYVYR